MIINKLNKIVDKKTLTRFGSLLVNGNWWTARQLSGNSYAFEYSVRHDTISDKPLLIDISTSIKLGNAFGIDIENQKLNYNGATVSIGISELDEDYPLEFINFSTEKINATATIQASELLQGLKTVSHAIGNRYDYGNILSTVNIELGDTVQFQATDGNRLAVYDGVGDVINRGSFNIPRAAVVNIISLLELLPASLDLTLVSDGKVFLIHGYSLRVIGDQCQGTYPQIKQFIKIESDTRVLEYDTKALYNALESLKPLVNDVTNRVTFTRGSDAITADNGTVSLAGIGELDFNISFNRKFLIDAIKIFKDKKINKVQLHVLGVIDRVVIPSNKFKLIVMPIRVNEQY
jgi:DNA polymerase III sliding clamp (beta) subunit (PCNA family)